MFALFVAIATSCGKGKPSAPYVVPGSPTACFTMSSALESDALCPYQLKFTLDASCATDDLTPPANLEVRWDYENDGTWDTAFSTTKVDNSFRPDPTHPSWTARVEVRDADGKTSVATKTVALGPFPTSPDLIGSRIHFRPTSTGTIPADTVHVNESFALIVLATCYGDFPSYETRILRDGVAVDSMLGGCSGGLYGCGGGGRDGWTIGAPGTYVFMAILDSDENYAETNENNNTIRDTLVVIP